jgi:aspartyl-tRNA(Asn)/glutamyl-tRNA(Gln) amidotransferase subunit C
MKISREDVLRVAELAYLELTESEVSTYQQQLDSILEYADKLNEIDTTNVPPMAQVLASDAPAADTTLRQDVVVPCWAATEILAQAPDAQAPYFRVPKVIDR